MTNETVKKNDFVELKYTGYSNGKVFDSNVEEDLKKIDPKAKPAKTIISVGNEMLVKGFDKALEGKEIGKEYEITLSAKEGFGDRNKNLVKMIPLKVFHERNVNPQPGMTFVIDDMLVRIVSVSGGRVLTDFNNPLAGKEVKYKFTMIRRIHDDKEKCESLFSTFFRMVPPFEIKEKTVIVKGPKGFDVFVNAFKEKFKEIIGKTLEFEEMKVEKKEDKKEEKAENKK
jgi:FKBP-type peptidyl-prolyl cis-trans isomerase 2